MEISLERLRNSTLDFQISLIGTQFVTMSLLTFAFLSLCYTQDDFTHMALETWIKVVEGKVMALDR